jgi:hypothetical protein
MEVRNTLTGSTKAFIILVCGHLKPPLPLFGCLTQQEGPGFSLSVMIQPSQASLSCSKTWSNLVVLHLAVFSMNSINLGIIQISKYAGTTNLFFLYSNVYSSQHWLNLSKQSGPICVICKHTWLVSLENDVNMMTKTDAWLQRIF